MHYPYFVSWIAVMEKESEDVYGDLCVSDVVTVSGTVTGNITVQNGGQLTLYGRCDGNLNVGIGAVASTIGIVGGDVVNHGGQVSIHGLITGSLTCTEGRTEVDSNTRILGDISGRITFTCEDCLQPFAAIIQGRESQLSCSKCGLLYVWLPAEIERSNRLRNKFLTEFYCPPSGGFNMKITDPYVAEKCSSVMGLDKKTKTDANKS
jgi:cytoskeletal protein CcmA (bactofilin family)